MNKVQEKLLDLFLEFKKVCEKHNLTYYLCGGSCLGAVRHKGFIPWDDDLDVIMPRKDYDKLMSLASEFKGKYFLQNYETDPCYIFNYAKLRDSDTTFIQDQFMYVRQNHGIWMDIFPLDGFSMKKVDPIKLNPKAKWNWHHNFFMRAYMLRRKVQKETWFRDILLNIYAYAFFWTNVGHWRNKMLDRRARSIPFEEAEQVGNIFGAYVYKDVMDRDVFEGEPSKGIFEGVEVNLPPNYDKYLTTMFGDYMTPPPENKRVSDHIQKGLSTEIGYKQYIKEHKM